jgi:cytochrome c oxidase cbb3-type subunit III
MFVPGTLAAQRSPGSNPAPFPAIIYRQHVNAGGAEPPGATMANPLSDDSIAAREGEKIFGTMNCDGCHGGGGLGWVGPSLVDGRWRYGESDGALFHSIFYGRPRGMPAYGGILPADAVWRLVSYLRAQPVPKSVPTQSWTASEPTRKTPVREQTP